MKKSAPFWLQPSSKAGNPEVNCNAAVAHSSLTIRLERAQLSIFATRWQKRAGILILSGSLLGAPLAAAQSVNIPTQPNAGLLSPMQNGMPDAAKLPQNAKPEVPKDDALTRSGTPMDEVRLEAVDEYAPNKRLEVRGFLVRKIRVEGATLFTNEELHDLVAPYEGREQTMEGLAGALEAINARYRDRGYSTTQAYIPPQDLRDGELIIHVQEGTIGTISLEGAHYYKARLVNQDFLTQKPGSLLNVKTLEEELNRSNRLNDGYRFKATLTAGEMPGQTDIKLKVAERYPIQISPTFDNQGRPFIGMFRTGVEMRNDSLTGHGDRLYSRITSGSGAKMFQLGYSYPLNKYGTELTTNFGYGDVAMDLGSRNQPNITGKVWSAGIGLTQPLDKDHHWVADIGLNWKRVSDFIDDNRYNMNDIRTLQAGLTYDRYDKWGRTYNRVSAASTLGGLGGNSNFFKMENYFTRIVVLPKRNMLILKSYAQWSPGATPIAEQYQLGGYNSVRGFTEGVLLGDKGFSAGIEHRFPVPMLGKVNPWLDQRLQMALFYDMGRAWLDPSNSRYLSGRSNSAKNSLLQGVGFGFRAQLTRYLQGFVDVGFGIGDRKQLEANRNQPTARIHIGIRSDLMPNDYKMRSKDITRMTPMSPLLARPLSLDPAPAGRSVRVN